MIKIKPSKSADSRTVKGDITKEQLYESSVQHIDDVREGLDFFTRELLFAGILHDHTKLTHIDGFYESFSKKLKGDEFKSEEWFQLHVHKERHHLNDHIPDDVTLIDVLERIADIVMAGMGRSGEVYPDMLDGELLQRAYANTIQLLKSQVEVES